MKEIVTKIFEILEKEKLSVNKARTVLEIVSNKLNTNSAIVIKKEID